MSWLEGLTWQELTDRLGQLQTGAAPSPFYFGDVKSLAHELHLHQVELEMQNRQLRESHARLEASRAEYAELYDRSPVGYATLDRNGVVLQINLTGATLLGLERSEITGAPLPSALANASCDHFFEALRRALDGVRDGDPVEVETRFTQRILKLRAVPYRSLEAQLRGALMTMSDITSERLAKAQRTALERERQARTEADARDHMKDQFLGIVSHELRAPLNTMLGWLQILRGRSEEAELQPRAVDVMDRNARLLARLVDDILDVSRIVSGKLQFGYAKLDLDPIVQHAIDEARVAAAGKNVAMTHRLTAGCTVTGDAMRLEQVVSNLLSNSIKFTSPGGHIDIALERIDRDIRLTVSDDGCGIEPGDLPHVFEHFRQANGSTTRQAPGLGLGLAIASYIVEAHAGSIVAKSEGAGKGTVLTVQMPASREGSLPPPADARHTDAGAATAFTAPNTSPGTPAGSTPAARPRG